jgi:hypothetical protein
MAYESNKFHMLARVMGVCAIVIVFYRYYRVRQPNDRDVKLVTVDLPLRKLNMCRTNALTS